MQAPKITRLTAENYKAFRGAVGFDVAPLTILFGRNGSGKSALLRLPAAIASGVNFTTSNTPGLPLHLDSDLILGHSLRSFVHGGDAGTFTIGIGLSTGSTCTSLDVTIRRDPRSTLRSPAQWIDHWTLNTDGITVGAVRWADNAYRVDVGAADPPHSFAGLLPLLADGSPHPWTSAFRPPPRVVHLSATRGAPGSDFTPYGPLRALEVGLTGEATRQVLGALHARSDDERILATIREAIESCFDVDLRVVEIGEGSVIGTTIECRPRNRSTWLPLREMGTGLLHALPLIVQAAVAAHPNGDKSPTALLTCEEPEAHCHPAIQAKLADVVLNTALAGTPTMVETHSETLVMRVRRRVAEGRISPSDVALYWIDDEEESTGVRRLSLDERGRVADWPEGWFDTALREASAIHRAMVRGA